MLEIKDLINTFMKFLLIKNKKPKGEIFHSKHEAPIP